MSTISIQINNVDLDLLKNYERKKLTPNASDILSHQISTDEAFSSSRSLISPETQTSTAGGETARWTKLKNYCLGTFQTRASDFSNISSSVQFSKKVRDRLAELQVTSNEDKQITLMQQNEENLREVIKNESAKMKALAKEDKHWDMIELVSKVCLLLSNTKSPQFYPAQFMLILELIDDFGTCVFNRVSGGADCPDYLKAKVATVQLLALNWSMILCRTSNLIPRLLLQTAFLRSLKFHPFKKMETGIKMIADGINGLGSGAASIYTIAYLVHTLCTYYPNTSTDYLFAVFRQYVRLVNHLENGFFKRYLKIKGYTFSKYLETHMPALRYLLSSFSVLCDSNALKDLIEDFYSLGTKSSFILSGIIQEFPSKFISKSYKVILKLISISDSVVPEHVLIHNFVEKISSGPVPEEVLEIMNEVWVRIKVFENVDDFVYVAAPLTKFIVTFRPPHDVDMFLQNVVAVLDANFEARSKDRPKEGGRQLTKKLTTCIQNIIESTVLAGKNFQEVLTHTGSIVPLMDFLDDQSLTQVSNIILNDISKKPFELTDQLSIRILLELSQMLFQSLSLLSPVDVVEKTNQLIEWFLFRTDFGRNFSAHLNFLLTARTSFSTSNRLLSCISRVAVRVCHSVFDKKIGNYDDQIRILFAFAFSTTASITNLFEKASLFILEAQAALVTGSIGFAYQFFDEFLLIVPLVAPNVAFLRILVNSLSFLLLVPSLPNRPPFDSFQKLLQAVASLKWAEDEFLQFLIELISVLAHSLRTEYVVSVPGIDSNNILYGGDEEYQEKGISLILKTTNTLLDELNKFKSRGVMATRTKIPTFALKMIAILADNLILNVGCYDLMSKFAELIQNSPSINDMKKSTFSHLKRVLGDFPNGEKFISKYFKEFL